MMMPFEWDVRVSSKDHTVTASTSETIRPPRATPLYGALLMLASAFGYLNAYLPGPCNALASRSADLLNAASDLLDAMGKGVDGVLKSFENIEAEAVAILDGYEP